MAIGFWEALSHRIEQQIASMSEAVASGNAKTYEEYKSRAGEIRGLRRALDLGRELLSPNTPRAAAAPEE